MEIAGDEEEEEKEVCFFKCHDSDIIFLIVLTRKSNTRVIKQRGRMHKNFIAMLIFIYDHHSIRPMS